MSPLCVSRLTPSLSVLLSVCLSLSSLQVWKTLMRTNLRPSPHHLRKLTSTMWQTSAWWATSWKASPRPSATEWSSSTSSSKVWTAARFSWELWQADTTKTLQAARTVITLVIIMTTGDPRAIKPKSPSNNVANSSKLQRASTFMKPIYTHAV